MKKIVSVFLLAVILFSVVMPTPSYSASEEQTNAAQGLYLLGLFNGTGTDENGDPIFDLDRQPTRQEAVTMLVRLLGKEDEALNNVWPTPFTDVAKWAAPYVGYAFAFGLTSGTSASTYNGDDYATAPQYITFVLRALGYESGKDFEWSRSWELSDKLGITSGQYPSEAPFTRGDVALISFNSLYAQKKDGTLRIIDDLANRSIVPPPVPTATPIPIPTPIPVIQPTPTPSPIPMPTPSPTPTPAPTPIPTPAPSPTPIPTPTPILIPIPSSAPAPSTDPPVSRGPSSEEQHYVLNTNTMKFHYPDCPSVDDMSARNKSDYYGSREDLIARGYDPCKRCNP